MAENRGSDRGAVRVHPFRAAIESRAFGTIGQLFTEDAVLNSPVAHRPYRGRDAIATIISAVGTIFEGFRFEKEIAGSNTGDHAFVFNARVAGLDIQGCDFVHTGADGLIDEITVMLRPLKAATVFAEKMRIAFGESAET